DLDGSSLATHDEAVNKEQDHRADNATNKACGFSRVIPANSLPEVSRNEGADDPQNGGQNEAFRLGLVSGHDEFRNHAGNEANDNCPKDMHLSAPPERAFGIMSILRE